MDFSVGPDQGTAEAFADELLLHFGAEDDLDDDLDEMFGADDEDDDEDEGFGGVSSWPSKVRSADEARQSFGVFRPLAPVAPVGHLARGVAKGVGKTVSSASDFATSAGQGLVSSGFQLFGPPPPVLIDTSSPQMPPQAVVADKQSLPPVYVSDPVLAAEAKVAPTVQSTAVLSPTTKFGASFQEGSVKPRRGREREAITRARLESEKELRGSEPHPPTPLVEDAGAAPALLDDGNVVEPCHGRLVIVSCMSCSRRPADRYGSSGNGCLVCDDYGAILVPASDLPSYAGTERFGFVAALLGALAPLAAPAAQLAGGAVGQRKQYAAQETSARAQKVYERLKQQLQMQQAQAQPQVTDPGQEKVSGIGGWLGGIDDLEDLDEFDDLGEDEDSSDEAFGLFEEDDDLDFLDDGDPLHEDLDEEDDGRSEGRIVRILVPRGRF